jgi:hypothetical protein
MYQATDNLKTTMFTASGQWTGEFTIKNLNDENDMITSVAAPSRISQRQYAEDYQGENKAGG